MIFKIDKFSLKSWLLFIIITASVAGAIVLSGILIPQISPKNLGIQRVAETSHNFSTKNQEVLASDSSTKVEPSPKLLERLPKPAKLIQSPKPIPQNYKKDRKEQNIIANNTNYGHFLYQEGHINRMMIISSYGARQYQRFEYLRPDAAQALMKMIYTARDEGVWLVAVSGFRTIEIQEKLFKAQIKRRGSVEAAAKVSAPPGYSEHHTGFAIDLTDGNFPKKDLTVDFENTNAYKWLTSHAQDFGFELSFPPNNLQGVSYEPWHWRYIGSPEAASAFAQARKF